MADDRDRLNNRFARYTVSPRLFGEPEDGDSNGDGDRDRFAQESFEAVVGQGATNVARVIIELSMDYPGGYEAAKEAVVGALREVDAPTSADRSRYNVFATLTATQMQRFMRALPTPSPVYKIWPDEKLKPLLIHSVRTIKSDACLNSFTADGKGIVWAVADSGIDMTHPHFALHDNLNLPAGLYHRDFSQEPGDPEQPLRDAYGHGTHVAGIIAGDTPYDPANPAMRIYDERDERGTVRTVMEPLEGPIRGIAPRAQLMSLKVMDEDGDGSASNLIAALEYLETVNEFGRHIRVHGVNLSVGYPFDASWYAAGQSPLCAAVNRLSRAGVVVVAAAGNDGAAFLQSEGRTGSQRIGLSQSINDPGNAEQAITVGATHGEAPHRYGVSYFSSRGPTADGRAKPDLVAPGERILSCAAARSEGLEKAIKAAQGTADATKAYFREESGTSMAAPHVSGAAAALLSIRQEFIGRPEDVKAIFCSSCTDLKRTREFQGAGLVDLMRAIQSV